MYTPNTPLHAIPICPGTIPTTKTTSEYVLKTSVVIRTPKGALSIFGTRRREVWDLAALVSASLKP